MGDHTSRRPPTKPPAAAPSPKAATTTTIVATIASSSATAATMAGQGFPRGDILSPSSCTAGSISGGGSSPYSSKGMTGRAVRRYLTYASVRRYLRYRALFYQARSMRNGTTITKMSPSSSSARREIPPSWRRRAAAGGGGWRRRTSSCSVIIRWGAGAAAIQLNGSRPTPKMEKSRILLAHLKKRP